MQTKSTKIEKMLLGKLDKWPKVDSYFKKTFKHPSGSKIEWEGQDGLIFTLFWMIEKLQKEVEELKVKILK